MRRDNFAVGSQLRGHTCTGGVATQKGASGSVASSGSVWQVTRCVLRVKILHAVYMVAFFICKLHLLRSQKVGR